MIETLRSSDSELTHRVVNSTFKGREIVATEIYTKLAISSNNQYGLDCDGQNNTFIMLHR